MSTNDEWFWKVTQRYEPDGGPPWPAASRAEKIERLVAQDGERAERFLRETHEGEPVGGAVLRGDRRDMIFVEGRWQEAKLGRLDQAQDRVELSATRRALLARQVVAVRGEPAALGALLWPRARAAGIDESREVAVPGKGAPWIRNLAAEHFPRRVKTLDWYHGKEHVSATARILCGEGSERTERWREERLDRLWDDRVDEVLVGLGFLGAHQRSVVKRKAVEDRQRYLSTNRARMRYRTFRDAALQIGSGTVESAIGHVVQHRMKRAGMRWGAPTPCWHSAPCTARLEPGTPSGAPGRLDWRTAAPRRCARRTVVARRTLPNARRRVIG